MDTSIEYPVAQWPDSLDIPLKESEEVVSIDLKNDLPEDPQDLTTLLVEEQSDKEHWLTIAASYCNNGKVKEGVKLAEQALDHFSGKQTASIHTFLTWAYLRLARSTAGTEEEKNANLSMAEKNVIEASKQDPTWIGNRLATVELYFQRGMYDRALEYTDIFIKSVQNEDKSTGSSHKPNIMFVMMRAKLMYIKKNYSGALRLFQELLLLNPTLVPDPRIGIGMCFWHLKDRSMAITAWERSVEISGKDSVASILVLLGKFHNSLTTSTNDEMFKKSFSEAMLDLDTLFQKTGPHPVLLALLQMYFYMKQNYDKVIAIYENKILPKSGMISNQILSETAFWTGRAYYAQGDYRKAFNHFQEALKKNEDNLLAKVGLGQSQVKNNLVEESILTFENIYQNNESLQEINYILGLLYASKCFNDTIKANANELKKFTEKAIQFLEKYVHLTKSKGNQMVITKAYLVLSELYEIKNQYKQSIDLLQKAIEQLKIQENDVPLELLNNLGCFYFVVGEYSSAQALFEEAAKKVESQSTKKITLDYNIARVLEETDKGKSHDIYSAILSESPDYISARVRDIHLKFINNPEDNLKDEIKSLLDNHVSNAEIRAFYVWYLKKLGKTSEHEMSEHSKETLVKYDSHDLYALISLANLYVAIARDQKKITRNSKDANKPIESYLKATQLYQKAIQVDPLNIFAAQGLAIIFAENKRYGQALEVFRKIRDSLDNQSVHINLGHCLADMREYSKAIENYEIALNRFDNPKSKPLLLNLLARCWYLRALKEKSLSAVQKALAYAKQALDLELSKKNSKMVTSYQYNVALLEFQVAELMRRSSPKERTMTDLEASVEGLEHGITLFRELLESKLNVVPSEQLEQRIQLGETTMKKALERSIEDQKAYELEITAKMENARKVLEEQRELEAQRDAQLREEEKKKSEKLAEEYRKLQEEAQRLIQERAAQEEEVDDEQNDDEDFAQEGDGNEKPAKKGKKGKRKAESEEKSPKRKRRRGGKKIIEEDDEENEDEDGDEKMSDEANGESKKRRSRPISKEFIEDSDEEANFTDDAEVEAEADSEPEQEQEQEQQQEQELKDDSEPKQDGEPRAETSPETNGEA
ncbi:RNA polymerase-associated protein CTR9 [Kluyveromyces marxianus]|nr:RNA polymerase-associated protein CTR9 [Kluyveromyces marxianus]